MTDLEITRLCAEAMGLDLVGPGNVVLTKEQFERGNTIQSNHYDPLHDDAQAMALVKTFGIGITCVSLGGKLGDEWKVYLGSFRAKDSNLNRAICECCAKMMLAKKGASNDAETQGKAR